MADADPAVFWEASLADKHDALIAQARRCAGESAAAGVSSVVFEPRRVGWPFSQMLSLTVAGTPSSGPSGRPFRQRASDATAASITGSGLTGMNALRWVTASMRASTSRAASTGDRASRR